MAQVSVMLALSFTVFLLGNLGTTYAVCMPVTYSGHRYLHCFDSVDRPTAAANCLNMSMALTVFETEAEFNFWQTAMGTAGGAWVGAMKRSDDNNFYWDGTNTKVPLEYFGVISGVLDGFFLKTCVSMQKFLFGPYKLNDYECSFFQDYICEEVPEVTTVPVTISDLTTSAIMTDSQTTEDSNFETTREITSEAPTTFSSSEVPTTPLTSEAPTTEAPTTHLTSEAPTTEARTTHFTSEAPTTETPTTHLTSEAQTTHLTSEAPTTHLTSEAPTTFPSSEAPTTHLTSEAPTTHLTSEAPTTHLTSEAPTTFPTSEAPLPTTTNPNTQQTTQQLKTTEAPLTIPFLPGKLIPNVTLPNVTLPSVTLPTVAVTVPFLPNITSLNPLLNTLVKDWDTCSCGCPVVIPVNDTERQKLLEEEVHKIEKKLQVDKQTLSSSIRKKSSASDDRPSAQSVGAGGIAVLVIVFGSIILFDVTNYLLRTTYESKDKNKVS